MSTLPAYASSRTPVLDEQLAGIARSELALSADEAHRLAGFMLDDCAPLRTPVLDERLILARHEFGDPAYVEAVIRSFAALPLNVCYSDEQLERIAGGDSESIPDSAETIASAATRLKGNVMKVWHAAFEESRGSARVKALDDLDERLHTFASPYERIGERFLESIPLVTVYRSLGACEGSEAVPAHDYDRIARKVGLPPTATSRMLLNAHRALHPGSAAHGVDARGIHRLRGEQLAVRNLPRLRVRHEAGRDSRTAHTAVHLQRPHTPRAGRTVRTDPGPHPHLARPFPGRSLPMIRSTGSADDRTPYRSTTILAEGISLPTDQWETGLNANTFVIGTPGSARPAATSCRTSSRWAPPSSSST